MALQMTWQPTVLPLQRRRTGHPLGLRNLGNTCYLNSVLQCLTYTPPLANFCLKSQHTSSCDSGQRRECPFCIIERRIVRSLCHDALNDAPAKIHSCLNIFANHFRQGRQEDAHEFLRLVLDACHNSCLRLQNPRRSLNPHGAASQFGGDTVVKDIFGGALRSQVKCEACGGESNKTDEMMDFSIDLYQANALNDALQRFFQPEVLDGGNKYRCDMCKELVAAKKQLSILKAPNVLVIQLKRFEGVHGGKIDRTISFEEFLALSGYMSKESQDPHPEYKLFGTIVHSGYSAESGHYYAYIKDAMGRWFFCNDSHVSLSSLQQVLSEKVYILFFSRTNQRPQASKAAFTTNGVKRPHSMANDAPASSVTALPLKTVATKSCESHFSEKDKPKICKNGKVPSNPMKFGNLKNVHANGNGHVQKNGYVEKLIDLKEPVGTEKIKKDLSSSVNNDGANENKSPNGLDQNSKHTSLLQYGNGENQDIYVKSVKLEACEGIGDAHMLATERGPESNHALYAEDYKNSSNVRGTKRKSLDEEESQSLLAQEDENFKGVLAQDASLTLRSCGWYDEVQSFMLARKRLCAQSTDNTSVETDSKNMLIAEAKRVFLSQIPESLKGSLIKCLRSYRERKGLLD